MPYKFTEAGNIVKGEGGHPVYIDDDDPTKEYEIDAPGAQAKINTLTTESNDRRKKLGTMTTDLATATTTIGTLQTEVDAIDDKNRVKMDEYKNSINEGWEAKEKTWQDTEKGLNTKLFNATTGTQFASSTVVKKTVLPPDVAKATFGHHFKPDGTATNAAGNPIYSKSSPGEFAKFDEAIEVLIDERPDRDSIWKATDASGSGGHTGGDGGDGGGDLSARENISAGLKARGV